MEGEGRDEVDIETVAPPDILVGGCSRVPTVGVGPAVSRSVLMDALDRGVVPVGKPLPSA